MPVTARNGALISNDRTRYYALVGRKPLNPPKPGLGQTAAVATNASPATASAGKELARLVTTHGSLALAEYMLGAQEQQAEQMDLTEMVKTYATPQEVEEDTPRMISAGWSAQGMGRGTDQTSAARAATAAAARALQTGGQVAVAGIINGATAKSAVRIQSTCTPTPAQGTSTP